MLPPLMGKPPTVTPRLEAGVLLPTGPVALLWSVIHNAFKFSFLPLTMQDMACDFHMFGRLPLGKLFFSFVSLGEGCKYCCVRYVQIGAASSAPPLSQMFVPPAFGFMF